MEENWSLKNRREVFKDHVIKVEHRDFFYSKNAQTGTFTVLSMKNWAIIVPVTKEGNLVLVRQFRVATGEETYEFPGGALEQGEENSDGALRELAEETGYTAAATELLVNMRPNPAFMDNFCYVYLASGCVKSSELNLDPFEDLEPFEVSVAEFEEMIRQGKIIHSITLAAYGAFKARLG